MPIKWFKKKDKEEKGDKERINQQSSSSISKTNKNKENLDLSKSNIFIQKNFEILPIISEKSRQLVNQENTYVFKIRPTNINKVEIKKAIENIFKVKVLKVRTFNYKKRIRGRTKVPSVRYNFKKALVKLKEGQKIDIFD
ncbi:MAG: hypothetical protein KatS3mg094_426 [Candidatus Parcubacteria bacterium]|nr:MAG: hypothetical protein KatS3mg094_426 [Candidatus Parcubacteria bacterium]